MANGKIFISYRREDTSGESGRLKDKLEQVFGQENIFYDVETLEAGLNFDQSIAKALNDSKVLLAMIGPHWLKVSDSTGTKRIQKPDDWVRKEIAEALKRELRVIPVLVNGAEMPDSDELPDDLKELSLKHAQELTSSRWNYDVGKLTEVLEKLVTKKPEPTPEPRPTPRPFVPPISKPKSWWARNYLWALGGIVGFLILVGMCVPVEEYPEQEYIQPTEDLPVTGLIDPNPDIRQVDPKGSQIYKSLELKEENNSAPAYVPNYAGKWWLREDGIRSGYFDIVQSGNEFSFKYYLFNVEVGRGSGRFEENILYTTYFEMDENTGNFSFAFQSLNGGQTWEGQTQANQQISNATLSRN
ncbi:MAG: toll/interleukin-1 receptor domain-containing protein [Algoriphagus sp.]|uniref:toll/interleukin-1 receptor domain-containing protein n=1 Tax=Algoriphagus sp. TaxID=1872435 RepID=UPI00272FC0A8|nr:toll/interleukin-1 receptor domain-containing protein [Algoriphagus sp.]MDP2043213.1 toll/interleukin-1 receptor domain-containing protein [Algoriphagus sp.]MDP3473689.1 toll/interleukin-1 receptor domain-containing protein [Algoriphagus sp.]